jgi:hypothetical protein
MSSIVFCWQTCDCKASLSSRSTDLACETVTQAHSSGCLVWVTLSRKMELLYVYPNVGTILSSLVNELRLTYNAFSLISPSINNE